MPSRASDLDSLIAKADDVAAVDAYQYTSAHERQTKLPYNIRITTRKRRASELGSTIHDQCTLVIAMRTQAIAVINKRPVQVKEGELLLIFPGQVHDYQDVVDDDVHWMFANFHLDDIDAFTPLAESPIAIDQRLAADLIAFFDQQFHGSKQGKRHTANSGRRSAMRLLLILEQMLENWLGNLSEVEAADAMMPVDTSQPLVRKIIEYISSHLRQPLAIADIGRALHLSPGHLRNEFNRHTGFGLGHYIRYMKMAHACRLMDTTDLSLAEIGDRCGYSSIYSFSRAFKTEKGISPSDYRKSYKALR